MSWSRRSVALVALLVLAVNAACDAPTQVTPNPLPPSPQPTGAPAEPEPEPEPEPGDGERYLLAAGDIACAPGSAVTPTACHHAASARLIRREAGPDLLGILLLGDTQYERGTDAEYASFDATWGAAIDYARVPVLPATGNHEYANPDPAPPGCRLLAGDANACGFERYFGAASFSGVAADGHGSFVRLFGRRSAAPLAVIVLDVGRCEPHPEACAADGPVVGSLRAWLADPDVVPPDACTVVAWHQARWSDVGHGDLIEIDPVWRAAFVDGPSRPDLVLNGHDHLYARMPPLDADGNRSPDGITQIIAGAGGREIAGIPSAGDPPGRFAFADPGRFGVLRLAWDGAVGRLTTAFLTEGGAVVDRKSFLCR
jgi:hypothetical protein